MHPILTFDAYAAIMLQEWHRTVTRADYARYVLETHIDRDYALRAEASKRRALARMERRAA